MKTFWAEFKKFIAKGNVVDLAVAVIIGNAFNKIVTSLVNDIIMPLISVMVGGADVSDWKWIIKPAEFDEAGKQIVAETSLKFGNFIQMIIDFLIIALTVFLMVKIFTYSRKKLNEFGELVNQENEKLKKKLEKKRAKKIKKGQIVEETQAEEIKTEEVKAEEVKTEEPKTETKVEEVKVEEPKVETVSSNDEMLVLLREIRDALKK